MKTNITSWYSYSVDRDRGFFRIFGYGLAWKDTRRVSLLFSERNGYRTGFWLGPILIHWLPR